MPRSPALVLALTLVPALVPLLLVLQHDGIRQGRRGCQRVAEASIVPPMEPSHQRRGSTSIGGARAGRGSQALRMPLLLFFPPFLLLLLHPWSGPSVPTRAMTTDRICRLPGLRTPVSRSKLLQSMHGCAIRLVRGGVHGGGWRMNEACSSNDNQRRALDGRAIVVGQPLVPHSDTPPGRRFRFVDVRQCREEHYSWVSV